MTNSEMVKELKKDRLQIHLLEIETLVVNWRLQLSAPIPFSSESSRTWSAPYRPQLEQDIDSAHMLRKHVRSRALWKHHTDWGFNLDRVCSLAEPVVHYGKNLVTDFTGKWADFKFTDYFLWTAIEKAFLQVSGTSSGREYRHHSNQGLSFGSCVIEEVASNQLMTVVENGHRELVKQLMKRLEWKEISGYWQEVKKSELSMGRLVTDVMKSSDIFYPCRFCRRLFRA